MSTNECIARAISDPQWVERFWIRSRPENGCIIWTAALLGKGRRFSYGVCTVPPKIKASAHRIAWSIANGRLPVKGEVVCHSCDEPRCINPEHLFIGTHDDNMADMCAKRRQASGSRNTNAVLTDSDVRLIRAVHGKVRVRIVAEWFGVSTQTIYKAARYKAWTHVP